MNGLRRRAIERGAEGAPLNSLRSRASERGTEGAPLNGHPGKAAEGELLCGAAQRHRTVAIERGTEGAPLGAGHGNRRLDWILSPEPSPRAGGAGAGLVAGVLALQGDFREHRVALEALGVRTREVRRPDDLAGLHGLVIPGGESTTMSKLMVAYGLEGPVRALSDAGGVVYGTCAGLITVSRDTVEGTPPTLGLMDIVARRNAFGRQVRSFEADVQVKGLSGGPLRAVFIRAPWVERAGPQVEVLARWDGHIVAARSARVLVSAFHPELTEDTRLHELFIAMMRRAQGAASEPAGAAQPRAAGEPGRAASAAPANC
jgi:pyridoxal 5'-phosphate synthase pdxT subunit